MIGVDSQIWQMSCSLQASPTQQTTALSAMELSMFPLDIHVDEKSVNNDLS